MSRSEAESLPGVRLVELKSFPDERGRFLETYRESWFPNCLPMVQGNRSDSQAGVLRGLHFHRRQADYWYVPQGRVLVGLSDLRPGSPARGKGLSFEMGEGYDLGLYIPPGVAHGYYAITACTMTYLVDQYYDNSDEFGVFWNDPELGLSWPCTDPILSARDRENPRVGELDAHSLLSYTPR